MKEEFLQFIWKNKLYDKDHLKAHNQDKIEILNSGSHNFDSGPDFFNAKIKINDTIWAGNVEVHVNSSDWYRHNHHKDKAYDNVVLQVVHTHDKNIERTNGQEIPTLELKFDKELLNSYESLLKNESWIPCENQMQEVDLFVKQSWLAKLAIERLEEKSERIDVLLKQTRNSWEEAFYIQLARNFGFKLNSDPFELLAKSLSINYLAKHKDNLLQIEALTFGQAGFLNDENGDKYYSQLRKEYLYLQNKFKLKPIENHLWKFLKSRPANFPTIRIAQFSMLIHKSAGLFSKIIETKSLKDFYKLFIHNPSDYWEKHYLFNKESVKRSKIIGKSAIDILLINTVIPFLFVYGKAKGIEELKTRAVSLLENIKPEKNAIVTKWANLDLKAINAFDTQALIQLKNEYCNAKKCLNCQIGNDIIKNCK